MWDPGAVVASLEAGRLGPHPLAVEGAPTADLTRSPAAMRVATHAASDGLLLFHFEHRYPLDLPASWVRPGTEEDAEPPSWHDGVLPEAKYQSFRHDLAVGSFHPGHRGKWTTHELCHALVGFAWRPGAPTLFHATAARLAELVPVALYYFLDEIGLTRCPTHTGGGPLYRTFCAACERAAVARPVQPDDQRFAAQAARFLDAELAAIARTRRTGVPVPHVRGPLDLCSDGLAYAEAHALRLGSRAMHRLAEDFLVEGGGWSPTLDALEERAVAVARAIALGEPLTPLVAHAAVGRDRWARQDLAFRLLTVAEDAGPELRAAIDTLVDALADGDPVDAVRDRWAALEERFVLPPAAALFAVGYAVGSEDGRSRDQLRDGLVSVCPVVMTLAEDAGIDLAGFPDPPVRAPLGDRFAAWLAAAHPDVAPLARFEAAVRGVTEDPLRRALGPDGEGAVWCDGARVLREPWDVLAAAEGVDGGGISGVLRGDRLGLEPAPAPTPWAMAVGRHEGELVLLEVDDELVELLVAGEAPEVARELIAHGVMRPARYPA